MTQPYVDERFVFQVFCKTTPNQGPILFFVGPSAKMEHPLVLDNPPREIVLASVPLEENGNLGGVDHQKNDEGSSQYALRDRRPSTAVGLDWRASRISRLHGPGFEVGASYEESFMRQIASNEWKTRARGPPTQMWLPPVQVNSTCFSSERE